LAVAFEESGKRRVVVMCVDGVGAQVAEKGRNEEDELKCG
jgi:hypothetical protein